MSQLSRKNSVLIISILQLLYLLYYVDIITGFFGETLILLLTFVFLMFYVLLNINTKVSKLLLLAFFTSILCFLCSIINDSGFGSALTQTCLVLTIVLFSEMKLTKTQYQKVFWQMIICLLLILLLFCRKKGMYYTFIKPSDNILLNPNCIALLYFYLFAILFVCIDFIKARFKYFLFLFVFVLGCLLLYFTEARTSLIAMMFFAFLWYFIRLKKSLFLYKLFVVFLFLSFIVVFVYIGLYKIGFLVGKKVAFGKSFYSGREQIWMECFSNLRGRLFVGFSNKIAFGPKKIFSAHNSLLAMLSYFGIINLLLFIYIICCCVKRIQQNKVILIILISSTFIMAFETMLTDCLLMFPFSFLFIRMKKEEIVYVA